MPEGFANLYYDSGTTASATGNITTTDATSTTWVTWTTAGTANADATWTTWATTDINTTPTYYRPAQPVELTPEQLEEQERLREERRQREEEARREREAAVARAEELLLAHLDEAQRNQYAREHSFQVVKDDRTYLIERGRAQNVYLLDECGKRLVEYCAHVVPDIPDEDNLLAQKFMLETDEAGFLRLANAQRVAA